MAAAAAPYYQHYRSPFGDTTQTKVFVGGLAWETPADVMRRYFDQFGDILEAVIITDKNTGKSKGYGFVTFREPESARRACENPNPVIDGRKANCNIASLGRPRPSPSPPPRGGRGQGGSGYGQGGAAHGGGGGLPSSSSYSGVAAPLPPPPPPPPPLIYPPYGFAAYPPDYAYHQSFYSPQFQQTAAAAAQYYPYHHHHHVYGSSSPSSSSSSSGMMGSPLYGGGYGYSRGAISPTTQRFHGGPPPPPPPSSYIYYPTTAPAPHMDAAAFPFSAAAPPFLQPVPRRSFSSPSETTQTPQQAETRTTEVGGVITTSSESPNT
ncbi:hypothetical protein DM860_017086 [Cuscuta australis]|uniref:RRM domain-containing protein n=1 Tax=Cuscuta australis TaxID=267555 RepID=A0A328DMZ4_9ASTE|nr:hypothetical protein DM860_017086 [Cuscuta australis]